ncbi:N-glycosylase/DNA lyase [Candidatus Woesearchaeota archaeon]|nr:N-glycosylase/DNA lyase [Candidatus Woesearchaeota archaeon]
MKKIVSFVNSLKKGSCKKIIDTRIKEFEKLGKQNNNELFKELCFCILTANFQAQKSIFIQEQIDDGFITLSESQLAKKLCSLGYRFYNVRAKYIVQARKHLPALKKTINSFDDELKLREWIVYNVKGLGMKESSHFLRNIGFKNLAILDFHIIDFLVSHKLVDKPKILNKQKYLEIEKLLLGIATKTKLSLAELDLYLWHEQTGKVLK